MTTKSVLQCPVCGSVDVSTSYENKFHVVPFAEGVSFSSTVNVCGRCGEQGDFAEENDERLKAAEAAAVRDSIENILSYLNSQGRSLAFIERALRLPQRTLQRWKAGECSAAGVALLRIARTFPWVLDVADSNFVEIVAQQQVVLAAANVLANVMTRENRFVVISAAAEPFSINYQEFRSNPGLLVNPTYAQLALGESSDATD